MSQSPFIYGFTVSEQHFTNREEEVIKLKQNLLQGINTTIISPRRWGKSSLVEKVIEVINKEEKAVKTVMLDLFSYACEEEFLEAFAREVIKASSNKWEDWLTLAKETFKQLIPKITIGVDPGTDFNLGFQWDDLKKHRDEILNLPEIIAQKKNIRFVICLDEFQNVASFPAFETFEKQLRAIWQRHKKVAYCLYGSKRHMMVDIFNNSSKPFYRFGDILLLPKIKEEKWVKFILESFKRSGKEISVKLAEKIPQLMKNHSWYVQQLSHYTWQKTNKKVSLSDLNAALDELVHANTPFYQREIEGLSNTQVNLIKAIVMGENKLTSSRVMQEYKLGTPRNVSKNRDALIADDLLNKEDKNFELLDPAFELWFKKMYFKIEYIA
ncbi:MAG: ATP-binding protein [Crocinitomicaceae bacterium]